MTILTTSTQYLGPARVQAVREEFLDLLVAGEPVRARIAVAAPYQPHEGDTVLVIGEREYFVIGVLDSRRRTNLYVPGDLTIQAGGRVRIVGQQGVDLTGPRVNIRADRLEVTAQSLHERFEKSYTWVRDALHVAAGRLRTVVEQTATLAAERVVQRARKDVSIDGEKIRLG